MDKLTHIDSNDNPTMVDVSEKATTVRTALASGQVIFPESVFSNLKADGFSGKKGPILQTAIIAGTMAAKKTHEIIPFCHPLNISSCKFNITDDGISIITVECLVKMTGQTGVEMEALHGVSAACLTIYDMCKALSHDIRIDQIQLIQKSGGKKDFDRTT